MLFRCDAMWVPNSFEQKTPHLFHTHLGVNARKKVSALSSVGALPSALKIKQALQPGAKSNDYDKSHLELS